MTEYFIVMVNKEMIITALADAMTSISEKAFHQSFYCNSTKGDQKIPLACRHIAKYGSPPIGYNEFDFLTQLEAKCICHMADCLGYWVDDNEKPYIPKCDK